jgi:hypothetical protein
MPELPNCKRHYRIAIFAIETSIPTAPPILLMGVASSVPITAAGDSLSVTVLWQFGIKQICRFDAKPR